MCWSGMTNRKIRCLISSDTWGRAVAWILCENGYCFARCILLASSCLPVFATPGEIPARLRTSHLFSRRCLGGRESRDCSQSIRRFASHSALEAARKRVLPNAKHSIITHVASGDFLGGFSHALEPGHQKPRVARVGVSGASGATGSPDGEADCASRSARTDSDTPNNNVATNPTTYATTSPEAYPSSAQPYRTSRSPTGSATGPRRRWRSPRRSARAGRTVRRHRRLTLRRCTR